MWSVEGEEVIKKEGKMNVCCVVTNITQSIDKPNQVTSSSTKFSKDFFISSSQNLNV